MPPPDRLRNAAAVGPQAVTAGRFDRRFTGPNKNGSFSKEPFNPKVPDGCRVILATTRLILPDLKML